jgi:hypothetical protein
MTSHRVYFGKGEQTIRTVPHRAGRPVRVGSATFGIFDARYGVDSADHVLVAAGTIASLDTASTTTTALAGRRATDRRVLTVADSASFTAGRRYLLEAADGRAELVRVVAVPSGTAILAAAEILGDYATGSTLRGAEVAATFPAIAADDEDNLDGMPWIVAWTFPDLPPLRESIHLERGEELLLATIDDLAQLDPMLVRIGGDRMEPALALAQAHRDFRTDLALAGANEADFLAGPIGRDAVTYLAAHHALKSSNDESARRRAEDYKARYQELRTALQVGRDKPEVVALDREQQTRTVNPASLFRMY